MSNHSIGYFRFKAEQKRAAEDKVSHQASQRNQAFLQSTRTQSSTIPDMRRAYQEVREKNYEPTQAEINYRRFTGGRVVDGPKVKK